MPRIDPLILLLAPAFVLLTVGCAYATFGLLLDMRKLWRRRNERY